MPAITRWDPYRAMSNINREIERAFEDFGFPMLRRWRGEEEAAEEGWMPAIDVSETKDEYLIKADLPGVSKDDVKVTLSENVLTVMGEKKSEKETKEQNYHRKERMYGSFVRNFRLPGPVSGEKVKAEYKNGVLTLAVPKAEGAKPKEIQIQ